jgi:hypothetical protein
MTSTSPSSHAFAYIETDVPADQTLVEWRREREAARREKRRPRRIWHIPALRPRWA